MHRLRDYAKSHRNPGHPVMRVSMVAPAQAALHVLIVDDEPQIRDFVSRVLANAGYRVTTAEDGATAIAAVARDGAPDLLFTDLKMPLMDGDELAARLRQATPDLKVLYFTGYSQTLFTNRGLLWEGEAFLEKPCGPTALIEGVSQLLFNRLGPAPATLARPPAGFRSLLRGRAKNPSRDVV
jgi:CheY-like chemotaxis protein